MSWLCALSRQGVVAGAGTGAVRWLRALWRQLVGACAGAECCELAVSL